ncbi:hypothetical protein LJC55_01130 [Eubacteriales bacterium OttesenSCG-928-N14]|nr:hypothetical protein [Eubacteriales bacterium OttesenSCG-928-N14]
MFFGRHRVDEDLERIRRANLTEEQLQREDADNAQRQAQLDALPKPEGKDTIAMILAAFSVLLPYIGVVIGFLVILLLLF